MTVDYWGAPGVRDKVTRIVPEQDNRRWEADEVARARAEELGMKAQDACREALWTGAAMALVPLSYPLWNAPLFDWHKGNMEVLVCSAGGTLLFMLARALLACRKASNAQFRAVVRYLDRPLEGRTVPERAR